MTGVPAAEPNEELIISDTLFEIVEAHDAPFAECVVVGDRKDDFAAERHFFCCADFF